MILMPGCSGTRSSSDYSTDGTNILYKGKVLFLTEYDGVTGKYEAENDPYKITYQVCSAPEMKDCPDNRQGVHEDDLSKFKKATYFTAYIDTLSVMYIGLKDGGNKEAIMNTSSKDTATLEAVRESAYNTLEALTFKPLESTTFMDKVIVKSNGGNLVLRKDSVIIPGILAVSKGKKEQAQQQVTVGTVTVMLYESQGFKFYQYGDCVVKIANSAAIENYIEFK